MNNNVRPENMQRITTKELAEAFIEGQINEHRKQIGDKKVLLALIKYGGLYVLLYYQVYFTLHIVIST